jgi:DNA (cytosine-5)-methyltransferase 1
MAMSCVSLFSGIGGFDLAFERAGMHVAAQVERDPACHKVLRRHFPEAELHTDVREFSAVALRPQLICGGFPCQDLSVAGRRDGLDGERSGLWFEFRRILEEATPRWVCIENVPGLLSSWSGDSPSSLGVDPGAGRAMDLDETSDIGTVLNGLADLGYGWAYRVVDSQWWGVAQRRRRVFIVGHLGSVRRAGEILFEPDCLPWDSPPSRETGTRAAALTSRGVGTCGADDNQAQANHLVAFGWANSPAQGMRCDIDATDPIKSARNGSPAIAFQERGRPEGRTVETQEDLAYCLTAPKDGGRGQEKCVAYQASCYREGTFREVDRAGPVTTGTDQSRGTPVIAAPTYGVRRLTPRECERLQGFPDDWTRYADDGSEIKDSPRYRMLGNAVTVDVAQWLGRRIVAAEQRRLNVAA